MASLETATWSNGEHMASGVARDGCAPSPA